MADGSLKHPFELVPCGRRGKSESDACLVGFSKSSSLVASSRLTGTVSKAVGPAYCAVAGRSRPDHRREVQNDGLVFRLDVREAGRAAPAESSGSSSTTTGSRSATRSLSGSRTTSRSSRGLRTAPSRPTSASGTPEAPARVRAPQDDPRRTEQLGVIAANENPAKGRREHPRGRLARPRT